MNLDDYITGTHDPLNPINQEENEPLTELEEQQEWNAELVSKMLKAKEQLTYCIKITEQGHNTLLLNNLKKIRL